jgi:hypothetical protein
MDDDVTHIYDIGSSVMFTEEFIRQHVSPPVQSASVVPRAKKRDRPLHHANTVSEFKDPGKEEHSFFSPNENDQLFWCFFIMKYGVINYEYPGTTSFANEKELKFKLIERVRKEKEKLKLHKIGKIKEDIEDELANKDRIGIKTFIALCIVEGLNVIMIDRRKYYEQVLDQMQPCHLVRSKKGLKGKFEFSPISLTSPILQTYRDTLFAWVAIDKPIKAASNYKVDELLDMCNRLGLNRETDTHFEFGKNELKKKSKKEIYDLLSANL